MIRRSKRGSSAGGQALHIHLLFLIEVHGTAGIGQVVVDAVRDHPGPPGMCQVFRNECPVLVVVEVFPEADMVLLHYVGPENLVPDIALVVGLEEEAAGAVRGRQGPGHGLRSLVEGLGRILC